MQKILIAPWGNFSRWEEVIYSFDGIEKESESSLSAIYESIKPDKVYILVLDTLSKLESENYDEIVKEVKEKTEDFITEKLGIKNFEVIVCPGVGTFFDRDTNRTYKFLGNLTDYYSYALYELSKRLDGDLEVHLDLTHGLNYMPVLTYRVIRDLLEALAIKNKVRLVVYNSDPYVGREKEKLSIHIVEDEIVKPYYDFKGINVEFLRTVGFIDKKESGNLKKEINMNPKIKELKAIKQNINVFIASIVYALPLMYSTFYIQNKKIKPYLDEIVNIFQSKIKINCNDKIITRPLFLTENFNSLVMAWFISKVCELEEHIKEELSIEEIEELADTIFRENKYVQFVKREMNSIRNIANILVNEYGIEELEKLHKKWVPIYKFRVDKEEKFKFDNFLAHGGFEKSITQIFISDYTIEKEVIEKDGKIKEKLKVKLSKKATRLRYNPEYIIEENGIKKFIFNYKNKKGEIEKIDIFKELEKELLNKK